MITAEKALSEYEQLLMNPARRRSNEDEAFFMFGSCRNVPATLRSASMSRVPRIAVLGAAIALPIATLLTILLLVAEPEPPSAPPAVRIGESGQSSRPGPGSPVPNTTSPAPSATSPVPSTPSRTQVSETRLPPPPPVSGDDDGPGDDDGDDG